MIKTIKNNIYKNVSKLKKIKKLEKLENIFNICFLIMFLVFSYLCFYTTNTLILFSIFMIILFFYIIKKINIKDILKFNFYTFISFSLLITIINMFLMSFNESINILLRLTLACNLSYTLCIVLPSYKLAKTIENLITPFKIFKINTQTISLIISIGITFIPILINQIETIRLSLVSKGIKYNSIKNIYYMIKTLIPNLFKKINTIDYSLISKGFNE